MSIHSYRLNRYEDKDVIYMNYKSVLSVIFILIIFYKYFSNSKTIIRIKNQVWWVFRMLMSKLFFKISQIDTD